MSGSTCIYYRDGSTETTAVTPVCLNEQRVSDYCLYRGVACICPLYNATAPNNSNPDNVARHEQLCNDLNALYSRKNHDYGDSFHMTFQKYGLTMAAIRLEDKFQRFESLINKDQQVQDESIRDTLIDLANYALMTVMEIDREKEGV